MSGRWHSLSQESSFHSGSRLSTKNISERIRVYFFRTPGQPFCAAQYPVNLDLTYDRGRTDTCLDNPSPTEHFFHRLPKCCASLAIDQRWPASEPALRPHWT